MAKFRWVAMFVTVMTLVGCNTMAGFGRDVERAGEKVQEKAQRRS